MSHNHGSIMLFNDRTGVVVVIRVQQMLILLLKCTVELRIMGIKDLLLMLFVMDVAHSQV